MLYSIFLHMENRAWLETMNKAMDEISRDLRLELSQKTFKWSSMYRVALGEKSKPTVRRIFGTSRLGRLKNFGKNIFRFKRGIPHLSMPFPDDSVVFVKPQRERLIIASKAENLLLKLVVREEHYHLFDEEVELLKKLEGTGFSDKVSRLRGEGMTSNGVRWLATTLADNSQSLQNHFSPEDFLADNLNELILEPMLGFYQVFPRKFYSVSDYLLEAKERTQGHPSAERLRTLVKACQKEAQRFERYEVIRGQLHFDLHAGNILYNGKELHFIDWEVNHPGLLLVDVFDAYRRCSNKERREERELHHFLQGRAETPLRLREIHQKYSRWMKKNFEAHVPEGSEKLTLMLYVLERSLMYFEKWRVDRLSQKGFEIKFTNQLK